MGNSASKTGLIQQTVKQTKPNLDESFGQSIMKNIRLKESPLISKKQTPPLSSNLKKRMELDKQTVGTVSWQEFPLIFEAHNKLKIDKDKVDELKKYFSLPKKSE